MMEEDGDLLDDYYDEFYRDESYWENLAEAFEEKRREVVQKWGLDCE